MKTSRVVLPFLVLLVLFSCTGQLQYKCTLQRVRGIINEHPDSALSLLDSMKAHLDDFSKNTKMQWQMLKLSAQNKCYIDFDTDSIALVLVDYFDQHGTSNERMNARYLLGRCYSDMGETPMALRCYQEAVDCADTTAMDCDFYTLCSIYGQMAMVFNDQHLPKEAIECLERYSHFAHLDHDVFNSIKGKEFQLLPYFALDDTANCFRLTEECHKMYIANGYTEEAASIYPPAILILLQDGQWQRARRLMLEFEGVSGFFDEEGNIFSGKEKYYYSKGLYYIEAHLVDSAEFFFRKLLGFNHNRNYDAYKGLQSVYQERRNIDSIVKYSMLCEQALDSIQKDDQSDALAIANSLYNYSRQEKIASRKALEAEQIKLRMTLAFILVLLFTVFLLYFSYKKRKAKERELGQMNSDYMAATNKYEQLKQELQFLKVDKNLIIENKQKEISVLLRTIDGYKKSFDELSAHDKEAAIMGSEIVLSFKDKAKGKRNTPLPNGGDWEHLMGLFSKNLPAFYGGILMNENLTTLEKEICMLCRLNFNGGEIAVLLDKSSQSITNLKTKINFKLFGQKSAVTLRKNLVILSIQK